MSINIVVPTLGESVSEATVAKWHKNVGETIVADEILLELETDKVSLEVKAPSSGKLLEIIADVGTSVSVGALLGKIAEGNAVPDVKISSISIPETAVNQTSTNSSTSSSNQAHVSNPIASPAASKIALDRGIEIFNVQGSGKDNRITKGDVLNSSNAPAKSTNNEISQSNEPRQERVKMTKLRKTIAERLKHSQNTAAILTTFNEVDMSEVFRIRKQYQEQFIERHNVKLGFMSFFAKAAVKALKVLPTVNAEIDNDEIIYKNYYDLGIAVGTDQGLVVPVLRNVDQLSFAEIEKNIAALGSKAKEGKLTMADMSGATFTITNGGTYGSLLSTPIINPPQSGILGMHNIVERPIAIAGQVVIRPMMYIALSYDHRIIDGKEAVSFLVKIKQIIENPEKLLFDL